MALKIPCVDCVKKIRDHGSAKNSWRIPRIRPVILRECFGVESLVRNGQSRYYWLMIWSIALDFYGHRSAFTACRSWSGVSFRLGQDHQKEQVGCICCHRTHKRLCCYAGIFPIHLKPRKPVAWRIYGLQIWLEEQSLVVSDLLRTEFSLLSGTAFGRHRSITLGGFALALIADDFGCRAAPQQRLLDPLPG